MRATPTPLPDPVRGVPLTVDALPMLVGHLAEVLDEIGAWKIKFHSASRLPTILRLLRQVAASGAYPEDHGELMRVGCAIQVAQEFIEIGNTLPERPIDVVRDDLRIALSGTLEWRPSKKAHLQRQTQLWVGAMMVQGGASTGVLERPVGKNPDFVLRNGSMEYAVEVKRPETKENGDSLVSGAAKQIRSGRFHGGSIVVDLTDCIDEATTCTVGQGEPDAEPINAKLVELLRGLHRQIFDDADSRIRFGRDHVFSLVGMARHQHWNTDDLTVPRLGRAVMTIEYQKGGPNTLKALRAKWLGKLIHDGIAQSGHEGTGDLNVSAMLG